MLAFVFPGQGAQKVGMGQALAESYAVARNVFERADAALGFSLSELCFQGPDERLKLTALSQPAILATSIAALEVVEQETGLRPEIVAGHSLGEYTALVAVGSLSFDDAVRLVHKRGQFMQDAVAEGVGSMAAVMNLEADDVASICAESSQGQVLSPANFNGGKQVVIAGHAEAVQRAVVAAKEKGGRAIPLKVSAPFHCALMEPAAQRMAEELDRVAFSDPQMPIVRNVDAQCYGDASEMASMLVRQIVSPVLWEGSVQQMVERGVDKGVELGPGRVLSGLFKRIVGAAVSMANVELPAHVDALKERQGV